MKKKKMSAKKWYFWASIREGTQHLGEKAMQSRKLIDFFWKKTDSLKNKFLFVEEISFYRNLKTFEIELW